jgi:hypothetical protein
LAVNEIGHRTSAAQGSISSDGWSERMPKSGTAGLPHMADHSYSLE